MTDKSLYKNDGNWLRKSSKPLKFIIVGAGIGGLSTAIGLHKTGHHVIVLEQAREIAEVGAGIQIAPNASRIFSRFGLLESLVLKINLLEQNYIRRYADDQELSHANLQPYAFEEYRSALGVIHRGDLQGTILDYARELKIDIRTSHKVVAVDERFAARAQVASGEWFKGDVVIAADGIRSSIRGQMSASHGVHDHSYATGDSAYRILIPREKLAHDSEALKLLETNNSTRWIGPGGHIMAYPIKPRQLDDGTERNEMFNMVLLHPTPKTKQEDPSLESWTSKGSKSEMLDFYSSWSPMIQNLLTYVSEDEVMEWTLNMHRPLPTWAEGSIALLGDASHPMLPYVAQGMANAVEDAGVLTEVFSRTDNIKLGLQIYQLVRKERAERIQQSVRDLQHTLHLPDGLAQQARDEKMRASMRGGANPDLWSDRSWQQFMWGVDVMGIVRNEWDQLVEKTEGHDDVTLSRIVDSKSISLVEEMEVHHNGTLGRIVNSTA